MSGQRKDPLAIAMRGGLWCASLAYGIAVAVRNRAFDSGSKPVHRCDALVVSVGNVTTGGTGKTPIVCFLAQWFRGRGLRVAIVSRGYGRGDADVNDEALELHDRLPDVPHVQDADRVEAARIAVEELESQVILMDDGFQHRRLYRNLDIVVVDATCPFGFGHLLPRGLLREPIAGLRRAELIMMTRCALVDPGELSKIESTIRGVNPDAAIVRSEHQPAYLLEHPQHQITVDSLLDQRVAIVSAIGNPKAFEQTVKACGAEVVASRQLPDHDPYGPQTVQEIRQWIELIGDRIDQVICTHKDLVKLRTDRLGGKPLRALLIQLTIISNREDLEASLEKIVEDAHASESRRNPASP